MFRGPRRADWNIPHPAAFPLGNPNAKPTTMRAKILIPALLLCGLAGCGQEPIPQGPSTEPEPALPELPEAPVEAPLQNDTLLRMDGIGDVSIGETLSAASDDLGEVLTHHTPSEGSTCSYAFSETLPGIAFMLDGETIVRIDVTEGDTETPEGIGIGATEEMLRTSYGDSAEVSPHKYVEGGHYFSVADSVPQEPELRYVFATDGERVTEFRAGRMPEVEWIEGCS